MWILKTLFHAETSFPREGGVLAVYMTGRLDIFFWVENLHPRYFFGSRELSHIFLGLKVCLIE